MKLDAIGLSSKNLKKTVQFYELLGFSFSEADGDHLEATSGDEGVRLMIDSEKLLTKLLGEKPKPGNLSAFAVKFDTPNEVDEICKRVVGAGFKVVKEPWDAFWGQRYAVVSDPDGFRIDLFAQL